MNTVDTANSKALVSPASVPKPTTKPIVPSARIPLTMGTKTCPSKSEEVWIMRSAGMAWKVTSCWTREKVAEIIAGCTVSISGFERKYRDCAPCDAMIAARIVKTNVIQ